MGWLPTDDWPGRALIVGAILVVIGLVAALIGEVAPPHVFFRAIAVVLVIGAAAAEAIALAASVAGEESSRRRRDMKFRRYYGERAANLWRSMPGVAQIAFGVVVPVAVVAIALLIASARRNNSSSRCGWRAWCSSSSCSRSQAESRCADERPLS